MPMHDWSKIPSGRFHHFHQDWSTEITRALRSWSRSISCVMRLKRSSA
jgi:hypothetical protein